MRFVLSMMSLFGMVAIGCAAPASDDGAKSDDGAAADEPELVAAKGACSKADYDKAFLKYKSAVDRSKARNAGDVCGGENYLYSIAEDAGAAVATCGQFQTVIATSKWAAPLRKALEGNLALAELTGKLSTKDWNGLSSALAGVTMYGPAPGATGHLSLMKFGAGNAVTLSLQSWKNDNIVWTDKKGTYTLGANGSITLKIDGKSLPFTIKDASGDSTVPSYELVPAASKALDPENADSLIETKFTSLPDECSA